MFVKDMYFLAGLANPETLDWAWSIPFYSCLFTKVDAA